jgi:hypothetical protein
MDSETPFQQFVLVIPQQPNNLSFQRDHHHRPTSQQKTRQEISSQVLPMIAYNKHKLIGQQDFNDRQSPEF